MKIYLAGPEIFRTDVLAWVKTAREICRRHGFDPIFPVINQESDPERIFQSNIDSIRKAQIVVANLDPFRGPEPDSGTAFELGFAFALGKKICGYVSHMDSVARRVEIAEGRSKLPTPSVEAPTDQQGLLIENFNLPCNLMLAIPTRIIEGGLEPCLRSIRARPSSE